MKSSEHFSSPKFPVKLPLISPILPKETKCVIHNSSEEEKIKRCFSYEQINCEINEKILRCENELKIIR